MPPLFTLYVIENKPNKNPIFPLIFVFFPYIVV